MEFITKSEIETEKIARDLAKKFKSKQILALYGDLGSGKTVFVKGLAKGLGIKTIIVSPTFVFIKEYPITKIQKKEDKNKTNSTNLDRTTIRNRKSQIETLIHVDCYRMRDERDAEEIGLVEYFNQKNNIIAVEWPEKIKSILPKNIIKINFDNLGGDLREIIIN